LVIVFLDNASAASRSELHPGSRRERKLDHPLSHALDILLLDHIASLLLLYNPLSISNPRGNDGQMSGHGLEDDIGEAFVLRTEDQERGLSQQGWNVVAFTQEKDMIRHQTQLMRCLLQSRPGTA